MPASAVGVPALAVGVPAESEEPQEAMHARVSAANSQRPIVLELSKQLPIRPHWARIITGESLGRCKS